VNPEDAYFQAEAAERLASLIADLPPSLAAVAVPLFVGDATHEEVAEQLGVARQAVSRRAALAQARMRRAAARRQLDVRSSR
jgi:DNA-directed RNA polymerase specialized sigma24 family protein